MPNLRHMSDLVASVEFYDVDIIRRRALSRRRARATLSRMRGRKHRIGADCPAILISGERLDLISCIRHKSVQTLHPISVLFQSFHVEKRFGLRRESRVSGTVWAATLPAFSCLTRLKKCAGNLCDRCHCLVSFADDFLNRRSDVFRNGRSRTFHVSKTGSLETVASRVSSPAGRQSYSDLASLSSPGSGRQPRRPQR